MRTFKSSRVRSRRKNRNIQHRIDDVDREGNEITVYLDVKPAFRIEKLGRFHPARRKNERLYEERVGKLSNIVKSKNLRSSEAAAALEAIRQYDFFTISALLRNTRLIEKDRRQDHLLAQMGHYLKSGELTEINVREIAEYKHQFPNRSCLYIKIILDRIRMETFPIFAYEDLSFMPTKKRKLFGNILSIYMHFFEEGFDPITMVEIDKDGAVTHVGRLRALNCVPAFTPEFAKLIEDKIDDMETLNLIVQILLYRPMLTLDVQLIQKLLDSPAPALNDGIL